MNASGIDLLVASGYRDFFYLDANVPPNTLFPAAVFLYSLSFVSVIIFVASDIHNVYFSNCTFGSSLQPLH